MPADVSQLLALASFARSVQGKISRQVAKEVAKTTSELAETAKSNAPVLTGGLRDSITGSAMGLKGLVEATAPYAEFVEYGTGHGPPQPYMNPAADRADQKFADDVEDAVVRPLDGL